MAWFRDNFLVAADTDLQNKQPDVGTSWTVLWQTDTTCKMTARTASKTLLGNATVLNSGVIYTADRTYPSPDYSVSAKIVAGFTGSNRGYLLVRIQDSLNMYGLRFTTGGAATRMYVDIAGTWTALGSFLTDPAVGQVVRIEINGSTLKYYYDDILQDTQTDTQITAAGKAGLAMGGGANLAASGDDILVTSELDNYIVEIPPYGRYLGNGLMNNYQAVRGNNGMSSSGGIR